MASTTRVLEGGDHIKMPVMQEQHDSSSKTRLKVAACVSGILLGAAMIVLMGGFGAAGLSQQGLPQWLVNQIQTIPQTYHYVCACVGFGGGLIAIATSSYFLYKSLKTQETKLQNSVPALDSIQNSELNNQEGLNLSYEEFLAKLVSMEQISKKFGPPLPNTYPPTKTYFWMAAKEELFLFILRNENDQLHFFPKYIDAETLKHFQTLCKAENYLRAITVKEKDLLNILFHYFDLTNPGDDKDIMEEAQGLTVKTYIWIPDADQYRIAYKDENGKLWASALLCEAERKVCIAILEECWGYKIFRKTTEI